MTTAAPVRTVDPCDGRAPLVSAAGPVEVDHDGTIRTYLLAAPEPDAVTGPVPLILDFHGYGGSAAGHDENTGFSAAAVERGFAVVTPDALGDPMRWNFGRSPEEADDVGFVEELVDTLVRDRCVDASRVMVVGHSNGSAFASILGCASDRFAAVVMVSATVPATCPAGVAPTTVAIHGTADASVPYGAAGQGGAEDTMALFAGWYACSSVDVTEPMVGVRIDRYPDCAGGGSVELVTIIGGTHPWPGSRQAVADPANSDAGRIFSATDHILDVLAGVPDRAGA